MGALLIQELTLIKNDQPRDQKDPFLGKFNVLRIRSITHAGKQAHTNQRW